MAEHQNRGFVVWFTGPSGAGKTTVATGVASIFARRGIDVEVLDGDVIRKTLCPDLGFSQADRNENIRRIGYLARLLVRHGVAVLVAAISPCEKARDAVKKEISPFLVVYCTAPLAILERRDTKGLYRRARAGEISEFTGISSPYEEPRAPDLVINSDGSESETASVERVIRLVEAAGFLDKPVLSAAGTSLDLDRASRSQGEAGSRWIGLTMEGTDAT